MLDTEKLQARLEEVEDELSVRRQNWEAMEEVGRIWARKLHELAGGPLPSHDPDCWECTVTEAIQRLEKYG